MMNNFRKTFQWSARWAGSVLLATAVIASAQYNQPVNRAAYSAGSYPTSAYPRTAFPSSNTQGRAAYRAAAHPQHVQVSHQQPARGAGRYQPKGEVRGRRPVEHLAYQETLSSPAMMHDETPIMPEPAPQGYTQPVEVMTQPYTMPSSQPYAMPPQQHYAPSTTMHYAAEGCSDCDTCSTGADGGICDYTHRSKGCGREKCPCPSDEALSYYRCGFYGHYPTLWRNWPDGFMKYRQPVGETMYDRFRPAPKGMAKATAGQQDQDLDEQLEDLLRKQRGERGAPGQQADPSAPASSRQAPDLLPEDVPPPEEPPTPELNDGSYYQNRGRQTYPTYPQYVSPVSLGR